MTWSQTILILIATTHTMLTLLLSRTVFPLSSILKVEITTAIMKEIRI